MKILGGALFGIATVTLAVFIGVLWMNIKGPWWILIFPTLFLGLGLDLLIRPKTLVEINEKFVGLHVGSVLGNPRIFQIPLESVLNWRIAKLEWKERDYSGWALCLKLNEAPKFSKNAIFRGKWDPVSKELWWPLPQVNGGISKAKSKLQAMNCTLLNR